MKKNLVNIIVTFLKDAFIIGYEKLENNEYKINIGTLYKRSIEESNDLLRFKERFKMKYKYAYSYAIESMGR